MPKLSFEQRLYRLKRGDTLSDPAMDGLRFRCRATGTYAELRFKRGGVWQSTAVGRLRPVALRGPDGVWTTEPGTYTAPELRKMAARMVERIAAGLAPRVEAEPTVGFTLAAALSLHEKHLRARKRSERTIGNYRWLIDSYLADWQSRALASISRSEARQRHERIGKRHGPYAANHAMRAFRACWNTAAGEDETLGACPTAAVAWNAEHRRDAAIPLADLPQWYSECMALGNAIKRDYLALVLWSGLRRTSAASIRRADIDLEHATLRVAVTKGGKPFTMPLSPMLAEIIGRRLEDNARWWSQHNAWRRRKGRPQVQPNDFLFPGYGASGHIEEPRQNGADGFSVPFTVHGLRNSYASAAASAGVSPYHLKILLNHTTGKGDVTLGYISASDVEALRPSQERVSEWLCYACRAWSPLPSP